MSSVLSVAHTDGLNLLLETLGAEPEAPQASPAIRAAWLRTAAKGRSLMIPLPRGGWLEVPPQALENLHRLRQREQAFCQRPPERCPACRRCVGGWDCGFCGYRSLDLERSVNETLASMHPAQYLPFAILLLPDPLRRRLLFLDASRPGQVLWEVPLPACMHPCYAQYLPEDRILVADDRGRQVLILDLLGRVCQRFADPALELQAPVMATRLLADDGQPRFLIVDRDGAQVLLLQADGSLCRRWHGDLLAPGFAALTADQRLLICDTGHGRVLCQPLASNSPPAPLLDGLEGPAWIGPHDQRLLLADGDRLLELDHEGRPLAMHALPPADRPHQLYLRRNGELVLAHPQQIWALRPGAGQFCGFWESASLHCQALPIARERPVRHRALSRQEPDVAQQPPSLIQALSSLPELAQAQPDVLEMARRLCQCMQLRPGQRYRPGEQTVLLFLAQGRLALDSGQTFAAGSLLNQAALSGQSVRALTAAKVYLLTGYALKTLEPYSGLPKIRELLPHAARRPAPLRLQLYYTPAERQQLLANPADAGRSLEIHLRFLPQGQSLEQQLALFRQLRSWGSLRKHRRFDGQLLVLHLLLEGDRRELERWLAGLPQLDCFCIVPLTFGRQSLPRTA